MKPESIEAAEQHLLKWFGSPIEVGQFQLRLVGQTLKLPYFVYALSGRTRLVTLGVSMFDVPQREQHWPRLEHVGAEFIVHCPSGPVSAEAAQHLLELVASYPLLTGRPLHFGSVVPLGPRLKLLSSDAAPQYILIAEPLLDDRDIYGQPEGQLSEGASLIQFLWAMPIFRSEAEFIAREGNEEFINLFLGQGVNMTDWKRLPVV